MTGGERAQFVADWGGSGRDVVDLGDFAAQLDPVALGRVQRLERLFAVVVSERGTMRLATQRLSELAVGDWVAVASDGDGKLALAGVFPRRNAVVRYSPKHAGRSQALAANVDTVAIVLAVDQVFEPGLVERYLAIVHQCGATPVVVASKADTAANLDQQLAALAQLGPGVSVIALSNRTGAGLDEVRSLARPGTTTALIGPSGVGKSSLVNALAGSAVTRTGEVRSSDAQGRHTTTWRELVALGDGAALIDTPGLRAVGLGDMEAGIEAVFSDVLHLADRCRFSNCAHGGEDGCAVRQAIEEGSLAERRLVSLEEFRAEAESVRQWRQGWSR